MSRPFSRGRWPIAVLLTVYLTLASLYNVATPIFEAPDEFWHFRFANQLARGEGLPVLQQDPAENTAGQEGGQPPLYYALGALLTSWINTGDRESVSVRSIYMERLGEGPNLFVHTPREHFPYRGTTLAVHLMRLLSTVMGAITIAFTYLIALRVLNGARGLPLACAGLVALIPQFLFVSAAISNDTLVIMLSTIILYLGIVVVDSGATLRLSVFLGTALAAAALAKISGLGLLPLAVGALGLRAWQERSPKPLMASLIILPVSIVGAGWWYVRNMALYGDPAGMSRFILASGAPIPIQSLEGILKEVQRLWTSMWAHFGWLNVPADLRMYLLYGVLSFLALAGLVRLALNKDWKGTFPGKAHALLLSLWIAVYVVLLVQWARTVTGIQGRLIFPALPALSIFLVTGIAAAAPRQWTRKLPVALLIVLVVPAILSPFLYILPAYPEPARLEASRLAAIRSRVDIDYAGQVRLLGYETEAASLETGQPLVLTMYWQALSSPGKKYTLFLHVLDSWGNSIGETDVVLNRRYPTAAWDPGDTVAETYTVSLREPADRPSAITVEAGLYTYPGLELLEASDSRGRRLGTSPEVARLKAPTLTSAAPPAGTTAASLGDRFWLLATEAPETEARRGQELTGTLWWKAIDRPERDYTVFVQIVGPSGLLAQYDAQPRNNSYPTSLWDANEVVRDPFRIKVPAVAPPGVYEIIVGMYDATTGERLRSDGRDYLMLSGLSISGDLAP